MSRLLQIVATYLAEKGPEGRAQLCIATGKRDRTILLWLKKGPPTAHDAFNLATGAGCEKQEALALARECFPEAKETA